MFAVAGFTKENGFALGGWKEMRVRFPLPALLPMKTRVFSEWSHNKTREES
jgi:hypothetical protein